MLLIADLHIGSIQDISYVYNTVTDIFEKEILFNKTDAVIFLGDYFHRLFKVNEEYTSLAINIMSYLVKLCKRSKTKIRIVYGTEGHEQSSYCLFNHYLEDTDVKILTTITEEELFPNVNVLYIPEEYIKSKEDHYGRYLYSGKRYDYVFGHGIIVEGMPMVKFSNRPRTNERDIPSFRCGELSKVSAISIFGHYHMYRDLGEGTYYLGSLFRDSFGEEEPKGYGIIEDGKFRFVENVRAYIYKTYTYGEESDIYINGESLINEINRIKLENSTIFNGDQSGKIRIIFNTPSTLDPTFRDNLRSLLFNDKIISPLIRMNSSFISEVQEEITSEYDFILDSSLPIEDKIHRYMNKQYDDIMSLQDLTKYITEDLKI